MKILMLDDQPDVIKVYALALEKNKYTIEIVSTAEDAKSYILRHQPTVAILDVNLLHPDAVAKKKLAQEANGEDVFVEEEGEGFSVAAWVKLHAPATGIVMLTSERTEIDDRIRGLDVGADDYIQKGMKPREFCARIRALVRRLAPDEADIFKMGDLEFDVKGSALSSSGGHSADLTPAEAKLLEILCLKRGKIVSREDIYRFVFESPMPGRTDRAVDNLVSKVRGKAESKLGAELPISAIYGMGYKLHA